MFAHKPVLVIVTSTTCGHCHDFKSQVRDDLVAKIRETGKVNVVETNFESATAAPGPEYHPSFVSYIGWFPEFILFTGDSWENHDSELKGEIMGGKMTDGKPEWVQGGPRPTVDGITGWINEKLATEPFKSAQGGSYIVNVPPPANTVRTVGSAPKYGTSAPKHPTISNQRRVVLTEGGRPLDMGNGVQIPGVPPGHFNSHGSWDGSRSRTQEPVQTPGLQGNLYTGLRSGSPTSAGSTGYVPTIGMRTNFVSSTIGPDIQ